MKINEYLWKCGVGTKKEIKKLIEDGYIKINNKTIYDENIEIKPKMKINNGAFMTFYIK